MSAGLSANPSLSSTSEANPIIRAIAGKHPKWYELVAIKGATIGFTEWRIRRWVREGKGKQACTMLKVSAITTAGVVGLNLRFVF